MSREPDIYDQLCFSGSKEAKATQSGVASHISLITSTLRFCSGLGLGLGLG